MRHHSKVTIITVAPGTKREDMTHTLGKSESHNPDCYPLNAYREMERPTPQTREEDLIERDRRYDKAYAGMTEKEITPDPKSPQGGQPTPAKSPQDGQPKPKSKPIMIPTDPHSEEGAHSIWIAPAEPMTEDEALARIIEIGRT